MSDTDEFTAMLQKEVKAIAERTLQIEHLSALNKASLATISDLLDRHPKLANVSPVALLEHTDGNINVPKDVIETSVDILPAYQLRGTAIVRDLQGFEWLKIEDMSQGKAFNYVFVNLFQQYMSPTVAAKMEITMMCRGFIKPVETTEGISTWEEWAKALFIETLPLSSVEVNSNSVLKETAFTDNGFFTFKHLDVEGNRQLWFVLNASEYAKVIFDLNAKTEEEFINVYIRSPGDDIDKEFFDKIFQDTSNALRRLALFAANNIH